MTESRRKRLNFKENIITCGKSFHNNGDLFNRERRHFRYTCTGYMLVADAELVGVYSTDNRGAENFAKRYNITRFAVISQLRYSDWVKTIKESVSQGFWVSLQWAVSI